MMRHPTDGRLMALYLSPERLISVFNPDCRDLLLIRRAIPRDAHIVDSGYAYDRRAFYLIFHHPSFEVVPEGQMIPSLNIQLQTCDE